MLKLIQPASHPKDLQYFLLKIKLKLLVGISILFTNTNPLYHSPILALILNPVLPMKHLFCLE